MKRPHFALPEIYDDSLSYYEVLKKLIKSMHVIDDNLNKIPEQIANEAKAREQADGTLQTNIDNEAMARQEADNELRELISTSVGGVTEAQLNEEVTARQQADTVLDGKISELKSDLSDFEGATGIEASVLKTGSATSGTSAWAEINVITNISLKANREYAIEFSTESNVDSIVYGYLADENGTKLKAINIEVGNTKGSGLYTPTSDKTGCRIYFQYGKTTPITVNGNIDFSYYPKNYVQTSFNSGTEGGFAFELKNDNATAYTNYYMFKFEKSVGDRFYLELKNKIGIQSINILAKYKDGTVGILCGLSESKPKKEITLENEIVGLGAYLPANYENTLYVYSDFRNSVLERMKNVSFENSAFGSFAKFGVVGDSLSVGYIGDSSGVAHGRNIYYSWGQVLARRYGNKCLNFGFSGATTKTWYSHSTHGKVELVQEQNKCQCYVVGLGVNDDVTESNVGSSSDINFSDYTQNADTFYGNYAKVIQTIMETAPTSYIFVFTIPKTDGTNRFSEIKNNAIKGVVNALSSDRVFVIETNDYSELFNLDLITDNSYMAHYTAIGYSNLATINSIMLSDCMNKNTDKFKDIAFIPFGNNDVIN